MSELETFRGRVRRRLVDGSGQRGETLIESLVTVALVSIMLISGASFVTVLTSVTLARQQQVRTANEAVSASEAIKAVTYIPCGTVSQYNSAFQAIYSPPLNFAASVKVSGVLYLSANGPGDTTANFPDPPGACTTDRGAQKIKLRVTRTGTNRVTEIHFVKRDNRCSSQTSPGVTVPYIVDPKPGQRC
jgi:type II secretory pathway pseudopilin PulG